MSQTISQGQQVIDVSNTKFSERQYHTTLSYPAANTSGTKGTLTCYLPSPEVHSFLACIFDPGDLAVHAPIHANYTSHMYST